MDNVINLVIEDYLGITHSIDIKEEDVLKILDLIKDYIPSFISTEKEIKLEKLDESLKDKALEKFNKLNIKFNKDN